MRTRVKVGIGVAGAVVVLVGAAVIWGPGLYAGWADRNAQAAPTLDAADAAPLAAGLDGVWTAQDGSYAGYRVEEVLRGEDATVTGRTPQVRAQVTLDDGTLTAASVTVDMASVATDQPPRDLYFRSTALRTGDFPTATFALTSPTPLPDGATAVTLTGDLTIHGVTRRVDVAAQVAQTRGGDAIQVVGSVPVTFADYGVEAPSLGFVTVEAAGSVEFSLVLAPE
ncbi:YceI family protein [Xylanimonas ulmi]|uniref:Polyisoprenoid-binding protein YceI n=1 Tax=Xylanimonas ulmi TaxID=228973 RepID=A0A4Q7M8P0_9MICO|nr:YceI family protein [Xylanibacterium ulmi]RZS62529.1 polyisoprenoid-binding protein YceI [Xylanibacterium ulmi]